MNLCINKLIFRSYFLVTSLKSNFYLTHELILVYGEIIVVFYSYFSLLLGSYSND